MNHIPDPQNPSNNYAKTRSRLMFVALGIIVLMVLILGFIYLGSRSNGTSDALQAEKSVKSMFSFAGSNGWYQGPTNSTSMALFSPADHAGISPCFTSAEYHKGSVNTRIEQSENRNNLEKSGATVVVSGNQKMSINTQNGTKNYTLEQYNVVPPSGRTNPILGGNELGFVPLKDGYLKIYGNCDTVDQLPSTIPALKALTFNIHALDT